MAILIASGKDLVPPCCPPDHAAACDVRLHQVAAAALYFAESLDLAEVLDRVAQQATTLFGGVCQVRFAPAHRHRDARQVIATPHDSPDSAVGTAQDAPEPMASGAAPGGARLFAPLIARGQYLGNLDVVLGAPDDVAMAHTQHLLHTFAAHAALAIDTADQLAQLRPPAAAEHAATPEERSNARLALIAHDLRNPLASLTAIVQFLVRATTGSQDLDRARVAQMAELADIAVAQIDTQVSALASGEVSASGHADTSVPRIDLVQIAQRMAQFYQQTTSHHQFTIHADTPELLGPWPQPHMERVIGNLLTNGIKYSPAGGEIRIRLSHEQDESGRWAMLSVQNQGIGIPMPDLSQIGQARHRAGNVGAIRGTGLGLISVREVVEQYGGTLAIRSTGGATTTMCIRLPIR